MPDSSSQGVSGNHRHGHGGTDQSPYGVWLRWWEKLSSMNGDIGPSMLLSTYSLTGKDHTLLAHKCALY